MKRIISLILKAIVVGFASAGVLMAMGIGTPWFGRNSTLMYFTNQSNVLIAAICLVGFFLTLFKVKLPSWCYIIKYVGTSAIALTGFVFVFILAPTFGPWAWSVVNIFTHVIVPIAAVVDFALTRGNYEIRKRHIWFTLLPSFLYTIYTYIAWVNSWDFGGGSRSPYFFLNWGSGIKWYWFADRAPYAGIGWWIFAIGLIVVGLSFALYFMVHRRVKNVENDAKTQEK